MFSLFVTYIQICCFKVIPTSIFRYTGKHYEELEKENAKLKEYLDRVIRENVKLQGNLRRDGSRTIHKLQLEKVLHEKHNSTCSNIELL